VESFWPNGKHRRDLNGSCIGRDPSHSDEIELSGRQQWHNSSDVTASGRGHADTSIAIFTGPSSTVSQV
jgi:hypothetical protein